MPDTLAAGAELARIRDIPRTCLCEWTLNRRVMRWVLATPLTACPWHGRNLS